MAVLSQEYFFVSVQTGWTKDGNLHRIVWLNPCVDLGRYILHIWVYFVQHFYGRSC